MAALLLLFLPAPLRAQDCLAPGCHSDLLALGKLHPPAADGDCLACHNPITAGHPAGGEPAKMSREAIEERCFACHPTMAEEKKEASITHPPLHDRACTACHNSHGAPGKVLLPQELPGFCLACHPSIGEQMTMAAARHAALYRAASCAGCHRSHYAREEHLLPRPEQALCLSCHGRDDFTTSSPLRNIATEITGAKFLHGPVAEGKCTVCHEPHGSASFRLLNGSYPGEFYAPFQAGLYDFCLQCHDPSLLSPDSPAATRFRDGDLNLHATHVTDPRKGHSCRACHEAHGGSNPALITTRGTAFGEWTVPVGFQATEKGGSCAPGCHPKKGYERRNPVPNPPGSSD